MELFFDCGESGWDYVDAGVELGVVWGDYRHYVLCIVVIEVWIPDVEIEVDVFDFRDID